MQYKPKSIPRLVIQRIWNREKTILLLFFLSIAIIIFKEYGNSFSFKLCILDIIDAIISSQEVLESLAISLLSGIMVYFLTIIVPEVRKSRSLLVEIEQTFFHLESCFIELAVEMQIGDLDNPDECANKAVENVRRWSTPLSENNDYNLSIFQAFFKALSLSFNKLTEYFLGYSSILSEQEIGMIIDIRQRTVSKRILYLDGMENALSIYDIHDYFKDISQLYKDIKTLHNRIANRLYKLNKKNYEY